MPTVFLHDKICFICGEKNKYPDTGIDDSFQGDCDLDTRPTLLQRSSVYMMLQRCISCGFCAFDLTSGNESDRALVRSPQYAELLSTQAYTETAVNFLLQALLLDHTGDTVGAGWAYLHAAWVCDDSSLKDKATGCRRSALGHFTQARKKGHLLTRNTETDVVLLVDLCRRIGEFGQGQRLAEVELELNRSPEFTAQLEFEIDLIEQRDSRCHTMAEALEDMDD